MVEVTTAAVAVVAVAAVSVAAVVAEAVAPPPPPQKENPQQRGDTSVWIRYNVHLPALSLWDGENSRSILARTVLLILHGAVLCKKWHLCGSFWED